MPCSGMYYTFRHPAHTYSRMWEYTYNTIHILPYSRFYYTFQHPAHTYTLNRQSVPRD